MVKLIRTLAVAIMLAAGVTSYHTQLEVFLGWQVDTLTAVIAPVSIDALAVICSVAVHLPNITRRGRITAVVVLVLAGAGSGAANWLAGTTIGSKAVHLGMVAAYLLAESVASQVRDKGTTEADVVAAAEAIVSAPVSPAPAMTETESNVIGKRGYPVGPRQARRLTTGK